MDTDEPHLVDHTAVRRFCKKHGVPMRTANRRRREVDLAAFERVKKEVLRRSVDLDNIADRAKTERERRDRRGAS